MSDTNISQSNKGKLTRRKRFLGSKRNLINNSMQLVDDWMLWSEMKLSVRNDFRVKSKTN